MKKASFFSMFFIAPIVDSNLGNDLKSAQDEHTRTFVFLPLDEDGDGDGDGGVALRRATNFRMSAATSSGEVWEELEKFSCFLVCFVER